MRTDFFKRIHAVISVGRALLDDQTASIAPEVYDEMEYSGAMIKAGTRINWNGTLMRAAVDLWDEERNDPENAPTLWETLAYKGGYRVIPETITVTSRFAKGERGWWEDVLYESLMDGNVYTPAQYAAGWAEVKE